jgi:uncharacterized protein (DUF2147 family)
MHKITLALFLTFLAVTLQAQSALGVWKTVDDETGEAKSHIQVYEQNGQVFGKVVRLLKSSPDKKCDKCPGERKDQPVLNMILLENMKSKGGYWQSGRILDPEKGKWYGCQLWLKEGDPNVLVVRGYLGPFYRTQYWHRVN